MHSVTLPPTGTASANLPSTAPVAAAARTAVTSASEVCLAPENVSNLTTASLVASSRPRRQAATAQRTGATELHNELADDYEKV